MDSLVLELQRDVLAPSVSVLTLLRKALVVARKLGVKEFQEWIELELNGYSGKENLLPNYRLTRGELKAFNPYHGYVPIILLNAPALAEEISKVNIIQNISELEELVKSQDNMLTTSFSKEFELQLIQQLHLNLVPTLLISKVSIRGILEAAKNIILEWSLKLEEDGILGKGMTFSTEEKQVAQKTHYTIENFYMEGNYSTNVEAGRNVSGNLFGSEIAGVVAGANISGTVNNVINQLQASDTKEASELADVLKKLQTVIEAEPNLSADDKELALQQVAVLGDEGQNPKKEVVKTAIAALRGIAGVLTPTTELVKEFHNILPIITKWFGC